MFYTSKKIKKWEYRIIERQFEENDDCGTKEIVEFLNLIGKLGWELISIQRYLAYHILTIKREILAKRKTKKSKVKKPKSKKQ